MTKISLIAAMDETGGIGKDNQLLCHLPADLQHFKNTTLGKPIIMGRKTFDSIGKPLPGRVNIVLSKTLHKLEGIEIATSLKEALTKIPNAAEVMIIGGADIYAQTISIAETIYLTLIHHTFNADAYFPGIDGAIWESIHQEFRKKDEKNIYDMTFYIYRRKRQKID